MTEPYRKKPIEVALPLEAINIASAREKSIRHGHPQRLAGETASATVQESLGV